MKLSRADFEALNCTLVEASATGGTAMSSNHIDTYRTPDGRVVVHEWAMGGESFTLKPAAAEVGSK